MRTDRFNLLVKKILSDNAKVLLTRLLFPFRNRFILYNVSDRARKGIVNLDYWSEAANLGDLLSPVIVDHMLAAGRGSRKTSRPGYVHLYAVGSILTAGIQDCTVWGSGILRASLLYRLRNRKFDFRAVRGPLTRCLLADLGHHVPPVYGDPAILMSEIYRPAAIAKQYKYGIIFHKDDHRDNLREQPRESHIFINIETRDYKSFIDRLNTVETVISSSLHGIILAETYGIPAIWLKPLNDYEFKFFDWYYSTGRLTFPQCRTLVEALAASPPALPDLEDMKKKLKAAFPYDLFE